MIVYINSVVNINIWRYSRKIKSHEFDGNQIMNNIVRSFFARKGMENRVKICSKIPEMNNLCTAANFVKSIYNRNSSADSVVT